MDQQRPFLYLTLFFVGFLIWSTWQQEHAPESVASPTTSNTLDSVSTGNQNTSIPTASSGSTPTESGQATATNSNSKLIHVKTDVLDLYINSLGGTIVQADLLTYPVSLKEKDKAVRIIDKKLQYAAQSGLRHQNVDGQYKSELAPNHFANFSTEKEEYVLADGQDQLEVKLNWNNGQGITVVKSFSFKRGDFVVTQTQHLNNQSSTNWVGNEYLELTHAEHSRAGNLLSGDIAYVGAAYYPNKYKKIDFGDIEDGDIGDKDISTFTDVEKEERLIKGGWIAMLKHYFISSWVPAKETENNYYSRYSKANENYIIGVKTPVKTINSGTSGVFTNQLYIGPTNQSELEKISEGLDLTVDYGIFAFVSKPIFYVMNLINKHIVSNWGWTIILLTLLIKIIFFYPSAVSYRSMARMKKMAPKIKEISQKYKNDPQAKQKETMAFYRKEKINPLGGCLPMLIQMPVFMGLYWVLQESVELRQAPWILWYKDLSIKDPTFILPVIMGASMFIQQKLNPPAVQDPMQQKIFTYLPVVFTVMFLFFPAGLVLYWVVNNILSIIQQYIINKKIIGDT
ncbi:MAG: membrane protein insertase YidC [Cocleimonas sp.]